MDHDTARRLIDAAYDAGWSDACDDHSIQTVDADHPIGASRKRSIDALLADLDPLDLLGLRGAS